MRQPSKRAPLVVLFLVAIALTGCGGATTETTGNAPTPSASAQKEQTASRSTSEKPAAGAEAKPAKQVPVPAPGKAPSAGTAREGQPETSAADSEGARETGRQACRGATAPQIAARYELPARHSGVDKEFAEFVADPPASVRNSAGYPRLVAALYAATLPTNQRTAAAAGCAEELALSTNGGRASSNRAKR